MAGPYLIRELRVRAGRVSTLSHPSFERRFLDGGFTVDYGPEAQIDGLEEEVLTIPFLLNVVPLVWLSGRTYRVTSLDATLHESLARIRDAMRRLYPRPRWDGELVPDRTVHLPPSPPGREVAILFSGGVDSSYTSLAHQGEPQHLITILTSLGAHGASRGETSAAARAFFSSRASAGGHTSSFVSSNLRDVVAEPKLVGLWPDPRRWMIDVQHGLGFAGLCAPVMRRHGIRRLLIAGCERDRYGLPGATHPSLLNALRWSDAEVRVDGGGKTRHEKLLAIAARTAEAGGRMGSRGSLRPCLHPGRDFTNCGVCEKCMQTILGLSAAGEDPRAYGFESDEADALAALHAAVSRQRLAMPDPAELRQWLDIQAAFRSARVAGLEAVRQPTSGNDAWFAELDLNAVFRRLHVGPCPALRRVRRLAGLWLDRWPALGRQVRRLLRG